MARANWKLKFFSKQTWRALFYCVCSSVKQKCSRLLKTYFLKKIFYSRGAVVPLLFFKKVLKFYKHNQRNSFIASKSMVGHKFGEFSFTRKPYYFVPKIKNKKKNIRR